ncbi:hypothetical protein [Pseudosporangium ferrugineum]|uniref:Uncharacterized protein n=1 Tax=Pseudosporangium ferrugineum TaxID=439699 RepID=A0A2T0RFU5_9ACTN|nr:hypothetical protein [Pseudosporangium ferrugineum]PRY19980.1 hypothetical protein CLV70_12618 [Pseudosporangium ferrugineum]
MIPQPGDVLNIGHAASVQFAGSSRLVFRVISISQRPTYVGWAWLTGYALDDAGAAIERREIFVCLAGLRLNKPSSGV